MTHETLTQEIRILTESELRAALSLDLPLVDAVEAGFAALAQGGVIMPRVLSMALPMVNAEVDVKTAYVPGLPGFAIKVSPGFFDNPQKGLASLNGLMVLLSAETGLVQAVFLDNGYLTDLRTAAAGAVAARHLAPAQVDTVTIFGTGLQARLQAQAVHLVRPFARCFVWGRDQAKASACAEEIAKATGAVCKATDDPPGAVRQSQIVVTTTPAERPIFQANWLHPGLHVTAMGSDQAGKNEIEPRALLEADLLVCDRVSQCDAMGELRSARKLGALCDPAELGQIVSGTARGRGNDRQITLCDLTGTGVQDTAIASFAMARIGQAGQVIRP